jgi:tRNA nucleotidyltransferase (CCA-adding enzyme)
MPIPAIKDIVKNNTVQFVKYRAGHFYYKVECYVEDPIGGMQTFIFPVPQNDIGDATLEAIDKAIIFMRYIRKALEEGTFIKA